MRKSIEKIMNIPKNFKKLSASVVLILFAGLVVYLGQPDAMQKWKYIEKQTSSHSLVFEVIRDL